MHNTAVELLKNPVIGQSIWNSFLQASWEFPESSEPTLLRQNSPSTFPELDPAQIRNELIDVLKKGDLKPVPALGGLESVQWDSFSVVHKYFQSRILSIPSTTVYPSKPKEKEIVDLLVDSGKSEVADRIIELNQIIREESDDDQQGMQLDSLRFLADFFMRFDFPYLPHGCITIGYDGILGVGWTIPLSQQPTNQWRNWDGILSIRFLPTGKILFAGETRQVRDKKPFRASGEDTPSTVFERIKPFFKVLSLHDAT